MYCIIGNLGIRFEFANHNLKSVVNCGFANSKRLRSGKNADVVTLNEETKHVRLLQAS